MNNSPEIKTDSKAVKWLDNFWYHYKWQTIGIVFAAFVLLVCVLQMCGKESVDVYVMYAGEDTFTDGEKLGNIKSALKSVLPEDCNGDGKKYVEWVPNYVLSDDDVKKITEDGGEVNASLLSENNKRFRNLVLAGEYFVCFLSPYAYETVKEADGFMPLAEILDKVPESAIDEYGILLKDTEFGSYYPGVSDLPDDTILCLRRKGSLGALLRKKSNEKNYENSLVLFRAIVNFQNK